MTKWQGGVDVEDFFSRVENRQHAWPPGRKDLHWLIIPDPDIARDQLYMPYRALAEEPGLCPVQPQWMHLTVLHAGPQNSATDAEVDQLVAKVAKRAADIAPFEVTLSRPDIGNVAIESKGYPGAPHRALWEMTWQAQQAVVGDRWPLIPKAAYPHLSHAYAGGEAHLADRTRLKVLLSDVPGGEVTVPVTTLTLVAEWHDRREIMWEVLAEVPLGGSRS
ncbi:2'-5' RNA ligase family protein [Streptomyces sp. NPDC059003]|uniref:2'-5' RNA ligase family protein n=1 Tax=Streptomyces sp. NPDC059003 TaxID=3346691 RepID=UPI00367BA34A